MSHSDFVDPAAFKKKEKGDDAVLEQKPELHTVEEFFTTLSPQSNEARDAGARPAALKRKSIVKKPSGTVSRQDQQQLEPLMTDVNSASAEQIQQQIHRRQFSTSLGGQTSAPPTSTRSPSRTRRAPPRTTPCRPSAPSPSTSTPTTPRPPFYSPDLLALSLSQQTNGILPQLDRQLVFGGYGSVDPAGINGQNVLDGMGWDGRDNANAAPRSSSQAEGPSSRATTAAEAMHAFGHNHEASSAWFMPFNVEPPEIGQDSAGGMGSLDQFANMFGGMTAPGGGVHHNGH